MAMTRIVPVLAACGLRRHVLRAVRQLGERRVLIPNAGGDAARDTALHIENISLCKRSR